MTRWLRARRATVSAVVFSLVVAGPLVAALAHRGYPVTDANLVARNVWVTNQAQISAGRVNMQIDEINGAAQVPASGLDVFQDGDTVYVTGSTEGGSFVRRIDPAYTVLTEQLDIPDRAMVGYGGSRLAFLDGSTGNLWIVNAAEPLSLDYRSSAPVGTFGANAQLAVSNAGDVFVGSPALGQVFRISDLDREPVAVFAASLGDFQVSAVGDRVVVLDKDANQLITESGGRIDLPASGVRLQQPGPDRDYAVVAGPDSLMRVNFSGRVDVIDADISAPVTDPAGVSAPIVLGSCMHGAWLRAGRVVDACGSLDPTIADLPGAITSDRAEFRVNRNLFVLNDVDRGLAWSPASDLRLIDNWQDVVPEQPETVEGADSAPKQTLEQTLADRKQENTPPKALNDNLGARPGQITVLPVLQNDTDADGDVLTVTKTTAIPPTVGAIETIDEGRALQFVPAEGATGTVSFRYTADDGRGGVAEAQVNVAISPESKNDDPYPFESSAAVVEAGQTVTYNVLSDWIDPDGDAMLLTGVEATGGDLVRFTPDGSITFTNRSSELATKTVDFTVSDGTSSVPGQWSIDVRAPGSLAPIGVPDAASTTVGRDVTIEPLANDLSPSGGTLSLVSAESEGGDPRFRVDLDHNTIVATAYSEGTYYLTYTATDGRDVGHGILRLDVTLPPDDAAPPIAVADTAYVRAEQPTSLSVLRNDVSPSGRVVGIQSVTVPDDALYTVEILGSTILRVSSDKPLVGLQPGFTYTISDGSASAVGSVRVVAVPELSHHQAPIAEPDVIKIRAGDFASVAVLANDFHPDGARMHVAEALVTQRLGSDGLAFVADDSLRIQAPSEPGEYEVVYSVEDEYGESSTARVSISVVAPDAPNDTAPTPVDVTARVFAGGTITVTVPLDGIDPEGDSTELAGVSTPSLGTILSVSSTGFTYRAFADSGDTDSFTYRVRDGYGLEGAATVHIGVIPRAGAPATPDAVDDIVSVKPGHTVSVPVVANDSDPNGYAIELDPVLPEGSPDGVVATVEKDLIVVEAGLEEGSYAVPYQIANEIGTTAIATLTVVVSADAADQPPIAIDHVVSWSDAVAKRSIDIDTLDGALNPSGRTGDLVVSVEGPNAESVEALGGGKVRVALTDARQAIAYRLTNPADGLSAQAFIVVPRYMTALPPALREDLPAQIVSMNETKEWDVGDIAYAPSGRPLTIVHPEVAEASNANGDPIAVDGTTLRYTPAPDFRGRDSITFEVTDGAGLDDPTGVTAILTLTFTVGDPTYADVAPSFTPVDISVEPGEAATVIDLRDSSVHPNPDILQRLGYANLSGATADVEATLSGSSLSLRAPIDAVVGSTAALTFDITYADFVVPGQVNVRVVASTRPLPKAVDDLEPDGRSTSTYTVPVLANDINPWAADGYPLTIVDAQFEGDSLGASVSHGTSTVTVTTGTAKSGTISVVYTVRDHTDSPTREAQGRLTIVVASAPEPVADFTLVRGGSGEIIVTFQPPSSTNGADVTGYRVMMEGSPGTTERTDCIPGAPCSFVGRTNGQVQTVSIAATNRVGTTWSGTKTEIPYGTPGDPTNVRINTSSSTAPANLTPVWTAPGNTGGGTLTYTWEFVRGLSASGTTTGTQGPTQPGVDQNDYRFRLQACNPGGLCSGWVTSPVRTIAPPPKTMTISAGQIIADGNCDLSGVSHNCTRINLAVSGFEANRNMTVECWLAPSADGQGGFSVASFGVTTNASGAGSWAWPKTCEVWGSANPWAVLKVGPNEVWSNTINVNN